MKQPAAPPPETAASLPANRAFVVQFADAQGGSGDAGRVEHLVSGRASHFDSWAELRRFVDDRLRQTTRSADAEAAGGKSDDEIPTR
jgi:hypothetical protein